MENTTPENTSPENIQLLISQLRGHKADRFLQAMFVPSAARSAAFAIYALEMELEHVHHMVKEEMIGHIRYAWWDESLEALFDKGVARGHPVLESLKPLAAEGIVNREKVAALVAAFRELFPVMPKNAAQLADDVVEDALAKQAPQAIARWKKAGVIIREHRKAHPKGAKLRLMLKLLLA